MTRLLGAEHEQTLAAASNLAHSPSLFGQKVETEQLLRDTVAAPLCAPGPDHVFTQ